MLFARREVLVRRPRECLRFAPRPLGKAQSGEARKLPRESTSTRGERGRGRRTWSTMGSTSAEELPDVSMGEAPAEAEPPSLEDLPTLSLEIFNEVKSSHAQHGLRHGDYGRYRQYCTRRLHRIRKSVGFVQTTGTKGRFSKKVLEPHLTKQDKHLLLPLYAAERAWSYAMALKRETNDPRPRFHLLHRLKKAAKWSAELKALCATRADQRTALEAEAYCGFMFGNMYLEREQWAQALTHLRRTRTICKELCRISTSDMVHLYTQVVEEVEPSIRFCAYNLKRLGQSSGSADDGMDDDGGVEDLLEDDGKEGVQSDILRSKLEAVMAEARAKQAESFDALDVLGERVPIKSDKVRVAIVASRSKLGEIEAEAKKPAPEGLLEKYDELFVTFNDALEGVRSDLRAAAKEQTARSGVTEAALGKLHASLTWQKLDHVVAQKLLLVEQFKRTLGGEASSAKAGGGATQKRASPEDIVRLYDSAIASMQEMATLDGYREDAALMEQLVARQSTVKACRCFYLAESYGAQSRYNEAQALYGRAADLMLEATSLLQESGFKEGSQELASLASLEMSIDGAKARAHAQAFVKTLTGGAPVAEAESKLSGMGLDKALTPDGPPPLIESPDAFERPKPEHLVHFPPAFTTVPCKPLLFDIARGQIEPPDLSSRVQAQGMLGRGLSKLGSFWGGR